MNKIRSQSGQSIIELVFSMGVIVLVLGGVISLILTSLHSRSTGFDRKKASELGQQILEEFVAERAQYPEIFWNESSSFWTDSIGENKTKIGYEKYYYNVAKTVIDNVNGCRVGMSECIEIVVDVGWSGTNEKVNFSRFFSK